MENSLLILSILMKFGLRPCTISNAVALLSRIHPSFKWLPRLYSLARPGKRALVLTRLFRGPYLDQRTPLVPLAWL